MKTKSEYKNFENLLKRVVAVPYSVVKTIMDAEKLEREKKRKIKSSASGHASNSLR